MVFQYLNLSYKFVTMKRKLSKHFVISAIALLSIYFNSSFKTIVQTIQSNCGDIFHGTGEVVTICNENIVISSFPEDGNTGSVIFGEMVSYSKIRILPGANSVRITPNFSPNATQPSLSGKGFPNGRRSLLRSASRSTNGRTGKGDQEPVVFSYNSNTESVSLSELKTPVVNYSIYNISGVLLNEVDGLQPLNFNIPVSHLSNGIYFIMIRLQNGSVHSGKIAKI